MGATLWLKLKRMRSESFLYIVMTLMSLLMIFFFGAMGTGKPRVALVDNDKSEISAAVVETLKDTDVYEFSAMDETQAQIAVEKGHVLAAVVIPEDFGADIGTASLTMIRTSDSADVMALQSTLRTACDTALHPARLQKAMEAVFAPEGIAVPALDAVQQKLDAQLSERAVTVTYAVSSGNAYDSRYEDNVHYLSGFSIFFSMFSIVFTLSSLLEDKKLRTWDRIRLSPISPRAVLAGNFIPAYVAGLLQIVFVLLLEEVLFGIGFGEALLPVLVVFAVFVLTAACLGLLMATAIRTYEQMNAVVPVVVVATSMLGGCMWPLSLVNSEIMLGIANVIPQKWAMEAIRNVAVHGVGLGGVWPHLAILAGMALVFFLVSITVYNKKLRV